jgi:broad specificity phosphatase PhoE
MPTSLVLVKHALPVLDPATPPREWRLSREGEQQAKLLAQRLQAFAPLRLVSSPEPKALMTALIVATALGVDLSSAPGLEEYDRPAGPLLSKAEHERSNAGIFADLDARVLGAETGRQALNRFSAALDVLLTQTSAESLVVITHGTVISLFVAAHNDIEVFEFWRQLACSSYVVLDLPSFLLSSRWPLIPDP